MRTSSYANLPQHFYARLGPTPVARPQLIRINRPLADELGLDLAGRDKAALAALFSGNALPPGIETIAMAYAGHQFGHFVPQLGDGRALLIGEARDRSGALRDIQLKGSGRTPFSRNGDGRAALGPVLREYLVSEAMHALGIPTTRSLAAVLTGEIVYREEPLPGAILTRVAASHVRIGTFQYFAARGQDEAIRQLADYVIERHYPSARSAEQPYLSLLRQVIERQARLVAKWLLVGFIHGVMNTDNMSLAGETIDYGPCAFMDAYDPSQVYSSIDTFGRYAYANQPRIAQWNLARLAETLLPLIDAMPERAVELATAEVQRFNDVFGEAWQGGLRRKLGLGLAEEQDAALAESLLERMHASGADFTLAFRRLADTLEGDLSAMEPLFSGTATFAQWHAQWRARLEREPADPGRAAAMRQVNPLFIPRNHRIEQVIRSATSGDFTAFEQLLEVITHPFDEHPDLADLAAPPLPSERVERTFCGT